MDYRNTARGNTAKRRQSLSVESLETRLLLAADLVSLVPANESGGVADGSNLVMTFGADVQPGPGTGNIIVRNADDGSLVEAINVRSGQVTIDGASVTIDPAADLPDDATLLVTVDQGTFRDTSAEITNQTLFTEDFEGLPLKNSLLDAPFDDYVVALTGVLDVKVAGDYTFGSHTEDGAFLSLDVDQDGLDTLGDLLYADDSLHGDDDRLHTCGTLFLDGENEIESCVGEGLEAAVTLEVGEYGFYFAFFNASGSGSGELFYAAGYHEIFDAESFALVGDDRQGIGVTADGITVTTYKAAPGLDVGDLATVFALLDDESTVIGSGNTDLANIAEISPDGRFADDTAIPGAAQWVAEIDPSAENWTDEAPYGWTRDNSDLLEGGAPEYHGWVFLQKEFWLTERGNDEDRAVFERGQGTLALVDPEAHDDFIDNGRHDDAACLLVLEFGPECGLFTASLSTPQINLEGVIADTAALKFDSSFWNEDTQSAETRVEYFDADGNSLSVNVLLRWESIFLSDNYKPDVDPETQVISRNEEIVVALENPANAASMVITFDMPYATNDWWWAIDNVEVTADVAGALFAGISDDSWSFLTGESVVEPPPLVGDLDGDGTVGFADFLILSASFGQDVEPGTNGDIDGNGNVGFSDFLSLSNNFGATAGPVPVPAAVDAALATNADDDFLVSVQAL